MSRILSRALAIGVAAGCLTGCAQRYVITTTTGQKLITANKPKLVNSLYTYKDATGQLVQLSAMRIRQIEPYSKKALEGQALRPSEKP